MSETSHFEEAQARVKGLKKTPAASELLELYSLYKQATVGDSAGKRPGMLELRARAKFDAWSAKKGVSNEQAREGYVALVARLEKKYED